MAAALSRTRVCLMNVSTITVPDHPTARLMYYMKCMCTVLDITDKPILRRLIDFQNFGRLDEEDTEDLVSLCKLFSPDVLLDKCIFHSEELCGNSSNRFLELGAARQTLAVPEDITIGSQVRHVQKVMTFKTDWLQWYYFLPLASFTKRGIMGSSEGDRLLGPTQEDECPQDARCFCYYLLKLLRVIICHYL